MDFNDSILLNAVHPTALTNWTAVNAIVSTYLSEAAFRLANNASLTQTIPPTSIPENPAQYQIRVKAGVPADSKNFKWYLYGKLRIYYGDGSIDETYVVLATGIETWTNLMEFTSIVDVSGRLNILHVDFILTTKGLGSSYVYVTEAYLEPSAVSGNAVQLDTPYYGVKIGNLDGITIERSDGKSNVIFNSDKLAFQGLNELGNLVDRIYFDPVTGKYMFDGLLSATTIEAIKAEIDIVVSNTIIVNNLYAQKGVIAELTVDQLDTSDKVANFLNHDTSIVKYIKIYDANIEFIEATTTGVGSEQLTDRNGNLVYWTDGNYEGITNDVTAFPVLTYVYDDVIKLTINADGSVNSISSVNFGETSISFLYDNGEISNWDISKDSNGNVTSVNGIVFTYSGSPGGGGTPVAPTVLGTAVVGNIIALYFDSVMADPTGLHAQFTVKVDGVTRTVTAASLSETSNIIDLTLNVTTTASSVVTLSYTKGTIKSVADGSLASFTDKAIYNAQTAPAYQSWPSVPDSPVVTTDYPYQAIILRDVVPYTRLILSKYKLFMQDDTHITNSRHNLVIYYLNDSNVWTIFSTGITNSPLLMIDEANNDVYTDSTLAIVSFTKSV